MIDISDAALYIFNLLADEFWPGPLTLIGAAKPILPSVITANTGWVGLRIPNHSLALRLLRESGVPVAAPSANRFGHVSPTTALHVLSDLGKSPMYILDSAVDGDGISTQSMNTSCAVGIESTVCKIDDIHRELVIFRRGGISLEAIQKCLKGKLELRDYNIRVITNKASHASDAESQQAPGQMLTHYAPDVATFLVSAISEVEHEAVASGVDLNNSVVIDFGRKLEVLKGTALAYKDLSPAGIVSEAATNLFSTLRWSELVPGATNVLLPNMQDIDDEMSPAVYDRLYRASSGRLVKLVRRKEDGWCVVNII